MKASQYYITTSKEAPAEAELISHKLMLKAGLIKRVSSGIYTWLPLGLKALRKIEKIVREEMNATGALEILMPAVQPAELWQESGRWEFYGKELLRIKDRHERDFCFGPTHEEVVVDLVKKDLRSYKQLPFTLYQIQTKFRDEVRPRFGVMRAREFIMKDAYSFHPDFTSLSATYERMYTAYCNIFTRLGLKFRPVAADNGSIGGTASHEFQVLADSGEDVIVYSDETDYAANIELVPHAVAGDLTPDGKGTIKLCRGIEVGHIFQLRTKYSEGMHLTYLDSNGKEQLVEMGCYGIGVSRILGAAIEQNHDDRGIIFPASMAPFTLVIVPVNYNKTESVKAAADKLYLDAQARGIDVLLDDRNERLGSLLADSELIGIPYRIVISEKTLANNAVEFYTRSTGVNNETSLTHALDAIS